MRNVLTGMPMVPESVKANSGPLFEQAVMLEIIHRLRAMRIRHRVCYWRTAGGAEVDCVIDMGPSAVPIEIYVVCLIDAPQRLEIVSWPFLGTICSRTRREGGV